jgi:hypothetical protein
MPIPRFQKTQLLPHRRPASNYTPSFALQRPHLSTSAPLCLRPPGYRSSSASSVPATDWPICPLGPSRTWLWPTPVHSLAHIADAGDRSRTSAASAALLLASAWSGGAGEAAPSVRGGPPTRRGTDEDWFGLEGASAASGRAFSANGSGVASLPQRLPMAGGLLWW